MTKYPTFVKNIYWNSVFVRDMHWNLIQVPQIKKRAHAKGITVTITGRNPNKRISFTKGNKRVCLSKRNSRYCDDMLNNFDCYFNAVQPVKQDGILVADYSSPRKHVLTGSGVAFTFTSTESPDVTDIYLEKARLKEGDVVLDMGAYCGATAYAFSKIVGESGKVLAFEPDNENYNALCQNINLHALTNVIPIKKAIWSSRSKLLFQGDGNMGSGMAIVLKDRSNAYEVETLSLDNICSEYKLTRVDFVKMDIEGSEVEVLKSAKDFLKRFKPSLIIEPHLVGERICTEVVCDILREADYSCEVIDQGGYELPLIFAWHK